MTTSAKPQQGRAMSVRTLALVSVIVCGMLAVLASAALIRTSSMLESATSSITRSARSWALASEVELALLIHQRVSNLYVVTEEGELQAARSDLAVDMRALLAEAAEYVSSDEESRLVSEVTGNLEQYLQERVELEARGLDIGDLLRSTQGSFETTLVTLQALHDINEADMFRAQEEAARWTRIGRASGASAAALLLLGLIVMAYGLQRHVLQPLLELHERIGRFRLGESGGRTERGGLREVRELSHGFNAMAEALAKQRENQLAFLAGVAHDLRNPLAALRVGIQALAQEQSEARRGRSHAALDRQVDRLARMVEDLLDATRIEAGKLEIRPERLDLRDTVEDVVRLYAPASPEHDISVRLPPEPVFVRADPLRIEQVVGNLLSNAIKFSPRGGPISLCVDEHAKDVSLAVSDQGIGIPPDEQADIFMPFYRRRADGPPGVGLGLSVVRRIVEAHGGSVGVDSEPGRGSTFRVRLPRADGPKAAAD